MATGVSKTKMNGNLQVSTSDNGNLSYHPIWQNGNSANRLYFGDNLAVMQDMLKDETIKGQIRLIYIDPPYATNSVFQTRKQQDAYTDLLTGNDYVDFIRERLSLMKELLADNGSIYVHLDNKMVFHIKVLMDEIFGTGNFRSMITRKKCKSKNFTKNSFGNISDYILFYTKSNNYVWNKQYDQWTDDKILKEYPFIEEDTGRRYKRVPIHAPGTRNGETGKTWRGMMPPEGKHWQFTPNKLEELDRNGEIYWSSTGNPRRKVYLDESNGIALQDIWLDYLDVNNQNTQTTGYPTEKNIDMLKRIILASSNMGDLVMDCFAGSGTMLVAADELKRNWIGVDVGNEAIKVILNRFKNGTQTLDEHIGNKKEIQKTPDLFSSSLIEGNTFVANKIAHHLINNYTIFANGKYSGAEFQIPENTATIKNGILDRASEEGNI
ncbi:MAG: site-specific DNA-methyltransferase [Dysgonamonadaceae bacterium]|jgi:adenine-specific DNA-methyltransferase|nr:site-specific DNA-methyltransferase [Dysgonamonadaceae bacterium]